jgi:hypothetical protein
MVIAQADGFEIEESETVKGRFARCIFYRGKLIGYAIFYSAGVK